jgi:hypothetical protein
MNDKLAGAIGAGLTNVLLAGSGAADLTLPEWLLSWDQQLILLSVGLEDRRARPAPEVLQII